MKQDVRVGLVGQGTVAAARSNECPHLLGLLAAPKGLEVVAPIPEVSHGLVIAQGAAGPDVAIGCEMGVGDAGVAGDDLSPLLENADRLLVIYQPEGPGQTLKPGPPRAASADLSTASPDCAT